MSNATNRYVQDYEHDLFYPDNTLREVVLRMFKSFINMFGD